jgi:hypothetical protein
MKIAICTPTHRHPTAAYVRSLGSLLTNTQNYWNGLTLRYLLGEAQIIENRNQLTEEALSWGADSILWIDDDMGFPDHSLAALLARKKQVIGCNYPTKTDPPLPTAFKRSGSRFQRVFTTAALAAAGEPEQVSHLGLGLCLISAEALRKIKGPIFQPHKEDPNGHGEDRSLFERLSAAGEAVWVDHALSNQIQHYGAFPYTNQIAEQLAQRR